MHSGTGINRLKLMFTQVDNKGVAEWASGALVFEAVDRRDAHHLYRQSEVGCCRSRLGARAG
jgi:hypothetical protein